MARGVKIVLWIGGLVLVLVLALVIFVATFNWNRLKPWVNGQLSDALGRTVIIHGDVSADWQFDRAAGEVLPWPHFTAQHVTIGNPGWTDKPLFGQVDAVRFGLSPWALLAKEVRIPMLQLVHPRLDLEREETPAQANWHFSPHKHSGHSSGWTVKVDRVTFDQGHIRLRDGPTGISLQATVKALADSIPYKQVVAQQTKAARQAMGGQFDHPLQTDGTDGKAAPASGSSSSTPTGADSAPGQPVQSTAFRFGWSIKGSYRGAALAGEGKSGGVLALRQDGDPFPVQLDLHSGEDHVALVGTLTHPLHLAAADLRLWLSGASMGDLYPTTGVNLPATPAFQTEGHLQVSLSNKHGGRYSYRDFHGRVGGSDLHGSLVFDNTAKQPVLTGSLHSDHLRATDLGSLVGTGPAGDQVSASAQGQSKPPGQVLPVTPFHTDRWKAMDAAVDFTGQRVRFDPLPPMSDLTTHIKLKNGMLQLSPLRVGLASGTIAGTITLDGSRSPMPGALTFDVRHVEPKRLFPDAKMTRVSLGQINGGLDLHMMGNSVAELLGSANGELKLLMERGEIRRVLLEEAGLNLGSAAMAKLFDNDMVRINCAAVDLPANDGVFDARLFMLDTRKATIRVDGTINLSSERLDLTVKAHTKGPRLLSLRSPITIQGTLKNPDVGVKPGPLIAQAAGAIALGAVAAPAAALLALISPGEDDNGQPNTCRGVLQHLQDSTPKGDGGN